MDYSFENKVDLNIIGPLKVENVDLSGKSYDDIELDKVNVVWGIGLDLRDWGVKAMDFAVPDQDIEISGTYITTHGDEVSFNFQIPLEDIDVDYSTVLLHNSVYPTQLEYWNGKWTLNFN